jgi:REP element-mobilizing transposase RayT
MRGSHVEGFERYRRRLPHWEEPGATYFLTATLHDRQLCDLSTPQLAPIIIDALRYFDGIRYDLYDYVVMPDHIHLILRIQERDGRCEALSKITHSLYRWMARRINEVLAREGQLWQHENYDHIVRIVRITKRRRGTSTTTLTPQALSVKPGNGRGGGGGMGNSN